MDVFALTMRLKEEGAAQVRASVDRLNRSFDEASGKAKLYDMTIGSLKESFGGLAASMALGAVFSRVIAETSDAAASAAQLNAVLKSTNEVAGQSAEALNQHAQALSYMTSFDDDAITGAQSLLLTFTKIQGDTFPKATQAVLDMATAMGTDLKGAAIQVGKALNDPILGVGALSRAGVQFNQQQKNMIELLVESNNIMGAQEIILGELKTQFEGSAAAAANTLGGAIKQLNNELGNLLTLSNENADVTTSFVKLLTDSVRGLNIVLTELGSNIPQLEGRLGSFFSNLISWTAKSNIFTLLAAVGGAERQAALDALAQSGPAVTAQKPTTIFDTKGEGTKIPLSRTQQIQQLLQLAEVTKLNAAQTALLRSEAARLTAEMNKQGVETEKQIELGTKLKAIQSALAVKASGTAKIKLVPEIEIDPLGGQWWRKPEIMADLERIYARTNPLPLKLKIDAIPEVTIPPERTLEAGEKLKLMSVDLLNTWEDTMRGMADEMANVMIDSIAKAFENLTSLGGTIGSFFKTLTSTMLAGLGSMLIEFGRYVIMTGKLMMALRKALADMNPVGQIAVGLAMVALGGALRGAASRTFGGGSAGGGGGAPTMSSVASASAMAMPSLFYGPTAAGSASTIQQMPPMNVTIVGPNDPSAQRQMQDLMRNAMRRGDV